MNQFKDLYKFIDLAEKNRKYPINTAHGRRAAVKLFETVLKADELESIELIQERIEEIYQDLIGKYQTDFSIQSLTTYKNRFSKLLDDYKKYGIHPNDIQRWDIKLRKIPARQPREHSTDSKKDISLISLSNDTHIPVHKLAIALSGEQICNIEIPKNLTAHDANTLKKIIDSLSR